MGDKKFGTQQTGLYPYPLGAGSAGPNLKKGRYRHRKSFMHRVYSAQRGIETMVSEGARPWGMGRSLFAKVPSSNPKENHFFLRDGPPEGVLKVCAEMFVPMPKRLGKPAL